MKGILMTSDECTPCDKMKETFKDLLEKGEIEEVNFERNPERAMEMIQKHDAGIPSLLILSDNGDLIVSV